MGSHEAPSLLGLRSSLLGLRSRRRWARHASKAAGVGHGEVASSRFGATFNQLAEDRVVCVVV